MFGWGSFGYTSLEKRLFILNNMNKTGQVRKTRLRLFDFPIVEPKIETIWNSPRMAVAKPMHPRLLLGHRPVVVGKAS